MPSRVQEVGHAVRGSLSQAGYGAASEHASTSGTCQTEYQYHPIGDVRASLGRVCAWWKDTLFFTRYGVMYAAHGYREGEDGDEAGEETGLGAHKKGDGQKPERPWQFSM